MSPGLECAVSPLSSLLRKFTRPSRGLHVQDKEDFSHFYADIIFNLKKGPGADVHISFSPFPLSTVSGHTTQHGGMCTKDRQT